MRGMIRSGHIVKCVALLIVGVLGSLTVSAQQTGFGVRGGVNGMAFENQSLLEEESLRGWHGGAYLKLGITESFGLQPELLFSRYGYSAGATEAQAEASYDYHLNYLDLPVMLRFHITPGLYILGGPQFSYMLQARERIGWDQFAEEFTDIREERGDNIDVGAVVGIAFELPNGLNIGARYGFEFSRSYSLDHFTQEHGRRIGQIHLGYTFGGRGDL
ncbi:porin family protein [Cytophagaceae bacterium ABcell3]|nr:porin family protein [Cytophagaceae bacterium ABcell3]